MGDTCACKCLKPSELKDVCVKRKRQKTYTYHGQRRSNREFSRRSRAVHDPPHLRGDCSWVSPGIVYLFSASETPKVENGIVVINEDDEGVEGSTSWLDVQNR